MADAQKTDLSLTTTTAARIPPTSAFLYAAVVFVVADIIAPQVVNMVLLGGFLVLVMAAAIRGGQGNLQGVSGSVVAACGNRLRSSPADWFVVAGVVVLVVLKIVRPDTETIRRFICLAILLLGFRSASVHLRRRSKRKRLKSGKHPVMRVIYEMIGKDDLIVPQGVNLVREGAVEDDYLSPEAGAWSTKRRERYSKWLNEEIKRFNNEYEAVGDAPELAEAEEPEEEKASDAAAGGQSSGGMPSNVLRVTSRNND